MKSVLKLQEYVTTLIILSLGLQELTGFYCTSQ